MYPKSNQASSVLALLEARVKKLKIDTFYNAKDLKIKKGFSITFNSNSIKSKNLIIATGSEAAPQLGSTNFGLEVAKSFGHSIIKPLPALVPLTSKDSICKVLNGLKLDVNARLFINNQEKTSINGDILFRDYGVSGLAILDISLEAIRHIDNKQDVKISIDFFKELNKKELLDYLKSKINKQRALSVNLWLSGFLHTKLANFLAKELNLEHLSEDRLNTKLLKELTNKLKNYTISIDGIREFKYAEVALGGVNSQEINPKTFESKKQKGLFFIGEVLDVVGNRGGYNFYFAWCSGMKVGLF
jgi:predicted Rossmann fold flavoprotein